MISIVTSMNSIYDQTTNSYYLFMFAPKLDTFVGNFNTNR